MGFSSGGDAAAGAEALAALGHPHLDVDRPTAGLSPATQQIIEIARALAIGCRVLVLDEPTSSLTQQDVQAMFAMIRRLKAQGHAIVYISHFLEEVRTIADRFTVLRDGKTVGGGCADDPAGQDGGADGGAKCGSAVSAVAARGERGGAGDRGALRQEQAARAHRCSSSAARCWGLPD